MHHVLFISPDLKKKSRSSERICTSLWHTPVCPCCVRGVLVRFVVGV